MVTCTSEPGMLRVLCPVFEDDTQKREIICYLRATETGQAEILYSHHVDYSRPTPKGPWGRPHEFKMELSPPLIAELSTATMYEFWRAMVHRVKDLPVGSNVPVPTKEFGEGMKMHYGH